MTPDRIAELQKIANQSGGQYASSQGQQNASQKKQGGQGGFLASLLPIVTGGIGTAVGAVGGPLGMVAGGSLGSGLGEFLRQKISNEEEDIGSIAREGLLGAVPGVFKGVGAVRAGMKAGQTGGNIARSLIGKSPKVIAPPTQAVTPAPTTAIDTPPNVDFDAPAFMRRGTELSGTVPTDATTVQNLGRGAIVNNMQGQRAFLAQKAQEAQQFNDLAKQNIHKLAGDRATQGLPLANNGGLLVSQGAGNKAPSFASEGIELQSVPTIPSTPSRYSTPFVKQPKSPVMPTNNRPAGDIQLAIEKAHNAGDTAKTNQLIDQLPDDMKDPIRSALGIPAGTKPTFDPATGKIARIPTTPLAETTGAVQPTAKQKLLTKAQQAEARAGGFGVGAKVSGKDPLGLDDSKRITSWLDSKKVSAGSPVNRLQTVENIKGQAAQNIDSVISRVENARLQPTEVQKLADDFVKDVSKLPGSNEAMLQRATEYAGNLTKNINSPRSAVDFKRQLDDTISYVSSPDAATANEQQLAKMLRNKLVEFTNQKIPGIKEFNKDYYNASDAAKYLTQAVKNPKNLSLFGTTIPGSGAVRQTLSSIGGQKVRQIAGDAAAEGATKGGFRQFIKPTLQQGGVRAASTAFFGTPFVGSGQPAEAPQSGMDQELSALPTENDLASLGIDEMQQGTSESQQLYEAAQRAMEAGDAKSYATLIGMAENALQFEAARKPAKEKPLSAEASKVIANAQSGLKSLDQVEGMIARDPSLLGKTAVPFREQLGGLGASVLGTSSYDTAARNIADVITRLRTGAAITKNEESFYRSQLPQPFDPPETVQQKLQMFRELFGSVASRNPSYSETRAADLVGAGADY